MLAGIRVAYLTAAIGLFLLLPFGDATLLLGLFVAVDLAAAALLLRRAKPQAGNVVVVDVDDASVPLLRRTVPRLRARRPVAAVEAQVRWREAAKARRWFRVVPKLTIRQ